MFGFGGKDKSAEAAQREAAIEQVKKGIREIIKSMEDVSPEEAERLGQRLKDRCNGDKSLPTDFKQKALKRARELECYANMRKADSLSRQGDRVNEGVTAEESSESIDGHLFSRGGRDGEGRSNRRKSCVS